MNIHRLRVIDYDTPVTKEKGDSVVIEHADKSIKTPKERSAVKVMFRSKSTSDEKGGGDQSATNDSVIFPAPSKRLCLKKRRSKSELFKISSHTILKKPTLKNTTTSSSEDRKKSYKNKERSNHRSRSLNFNRNSTLNSRSIGCEVKRSKRYSTKKKEIKVVSANKTPYFTTKLKNKNQERANTYTNKLPNDMFGFQKSNRQFDPCLYQMSCHFFDIDKQSAFNMLRKRLRYKQSCKRQKQRPEDQNVSKKRHHQVKVLNSEEVLSPEEEVVKYYNLNDHGSLHKTSSFRKTYSDTWKKHFENYNLTKDADVYVSPSALIPITKCNVDRATGDSKAEFPSGRPSYSQSKHKLSKKSEPASSERSNLVAGLVNSITACKVDIPKKNTTKIRMKDICVGLLIIVWSPCLLAVILAMIIMYPWRLTRLLCNNCPSYHGLLKKFRPKCLVHECQRIRSSYSSPRHKSVLSSIASWFTRAAATAVTSFHAMSALVRPNANRPPTCAGSSFVPLKTPRLKNKSNLYYANDKENVMKSAHHRSLYQNRCEYSSKMRSRLFSKGSSDVCRPTKQEILKDLSPAIYYSCDKGSKHKDDGCCCSSSNSPASKKKQVNIISAQNNSTVATNNDSNTCTHHQILANTHTVVPNSTPCVMLNTLPHYCVGMVYGVTTHYHCGVHCRNLTGQKTTHNCKANNVKAVKVSKIVKKHQATSVDDIPHSRRAYTKQTQVQCQTSVLTPQIDITRPIKSNPNELVNDLQSPTTQINDNVDLSLKVCKNSYQQSSASQADTSQIDSLHITQSQSITPKLQTKQDASTGRELANKATSHSPSIIVKPVVHNTKRNVLNKSMQYKSVVDKNCPNVPIKSSKFKRNCKWTLASGEQNASLMPVSSQIDSLMEELLKTPVEKKIFEGISKPCQTQKSTRSQGITFPSTFVLGTTINSDSSQKSNKLISIVKGFSDLKNKYYLSMITKLSNYPCDYNNEDKLLLPKRRCKFGYKKDHIKASLNSVLPFIKAVALTYKEKFKHARCILANEYQKTKKAISTPLHKNISQIPINNKTKPSSFNKTTQWPSKTIEPKKCPLVRIPATHSNNTRRNSNSHLREKCIQSKDGNFIKKQASRTNEMKVLMKSLSTDNSEHSYNTKKAIEYLLRNKAKCPCDIAVQKNSLTIENKDKSLQHTSKNAYKNTKIQTSSSLERNRKYPTRSKAVSTSSIRKLGKLYHLRNKATQCNNNINEVNPSQKRFCNYGYGLAPTQTDLDKKKFDKACPCVLIRQTPEMIDTAVSFDKALGNKYNTRNTCTSPLLGRATNKTNRSQTNACRCFHKIAATQTDLKKQKLDEACPCELIRQFPESCLTPGKTEISQTSPSLEILCKCKVKATNTSSLFEKVIRRGARRKDINRSSSRKKVSDCACKVAETQTNLVKKKSDKACPCVLIRELPKSYLTDVKTKVQETSFSFEKVLEGECGVGKCNAKKINTSPSLEIATDGGCWRRPGDTYIDISRKKMDSACPCTLGMANQYPKSDKLEIIKPIKSLDKATETYETIIASPYATVAECVNKMTGTSSSLEKVFLYDCGTKEKRDFLIKSLSCCCSIESIRAECSNHNSAHLSRNMMEFQISQHVPAQQSSKHYRPRRSKTFKDQSCQKTLISQTQAKQLPQNTSTPKSSKSQNSAISLLSPLESLTNRHATINAKEHLTHTTRRRLLISPKHNMSSSGGELYPHEICYQTRNKLITTDNSCFSQREGRSESFSQMSINPKDCLCHDDESKENKTPLVKLHPKSICSPHQSVFISNRILEQPRKSYNSNIRFPRYSVRSVPSQTSIRSIITSRHKILCLSKTKSANKNLKHPRKVSRTLRNTKLDSPDSAQNKRQSTTYKRSVCQHSKKPHRVGLFNNIQCSNRPIIANTYDTNSLRWISKTSNQNPKNIVCQPNNVSRHSKSTQLRCITPTPKKPNKYASIAKSNQTSKHLSFANITKKCISQPKPQLELPRNSTLKHSCQQTLAQYLHNNQLNTTRCEQGTGMSGLRMCVHRKQALSKLPCSDTALESRSQPGLSYKILPEFQRSSCKSTQLPYNLSFSSFVSPTVDPSQAVNDIVIPQQNLYSTNILRCPRTDSCFDPKFNYPALKQLSGQTGDVCCNKKALMEPQTASKQNRKLWPGPIDKGKLQKYQSAERYTQTGREVMPRTAKGAQRDASSRVICHNSTAKQSPEFKLSKCCNKRSSLKFQSKSLLGRQSIPLSQAKIEILPAKCPCVETQTVNYDQAARKQQTQDMEQKQNTIKGPVKEVEDDKEVEEERSCWQQIVKGVKEADKQAWPMQIACNYVYIHTLKHRPHFWVFKKWPSLYPYFLNIYKIHTSICKIFMFVATACVCCPCFYCVYYCCQSLICALLD